MALANADLREVVIRLGPWHHEIDVTPEVSTAVSLEAPRESHPDEYGTVFFYKPRAGFKGALSTIYPDGLQGRSVLDCACNCGAFLFWAKELGAGDCFGFDVREHWIKQARFLLENRSWPSEGIRFEVRDLYELPTLGLEPFDVTVFNGIFYHLPDPITGLKIAAELTKELMFIDTATKSDHPDGFLAASTESREELLSGVYGLHWLPTGPDVLRRILKWSGFVETTLLRWEEAVEVSPGSGRLQLVASKVPGVLRAFNKGTVARFFRGISGTDVRDVQHTIRAYCSAGVELFRDPEVAGTRSVQGKDSVLQYVEELWGQHPEHYFMLEATREAGDSVLARVHEEHLGKSSGSERTTRWVFGFAGGSISRIEIYSDPGHALKALERSVEMEGSDG